MSLFKVEIPFWRQTSRHISIAAGGGDWTAGFGSPNDCAERRWPVNDDFCYPAGERVVGGGRCRAGRWPQRTPGPGRLRVLGFLWLCGGWSADDLVANAAGRRRSADGFVSAGGCVDVGLAGFGVFGRPAWLLRCLLACWCGQAVIGWATTERRGRRAVRLANGGADESVAWLMAVGLANGGKGGGGPADARRVAVGEGDGWRLWRRRRTGSGGGGPTTAVATRSHGRP
ncbi:uncharacterized protein A4U43_C03F20460 [Asparagus officinalis]|uniref:Uncharacterized protein n=1 Tax=Asparagus officinalis TaxID=4686 RepID=A0A5P1FFX1_ASPOF|nr:uncharacterized protein A4U43_C03F20460 [Asparagus officinalis]